MQGWTVSWGPASAANAAGTADRGTRSLAVTLSGGYPSVGVAGGTSTAGLQLGSRITARVHLPADAPARLVEPWTQDGTWQVRKAPGVLLQPGAWTTVSWVVPTSDVVGLGLQVDAESWAGTVHVDDVSW